MRLKGSFNFGLGFKVIGVAVDTALSFLLQLVSADAADQSLVDATTYNSDNSDFIIDGSVTTDITGSASIASGELILNNAGLYGESRTRTSGRLFAVEFTVPTGGVNYFGHNSALAVSTNIEGLRISGTTLQAAIQGTFIDVGVVTVGQTYTLYIDVDTTGFFGFIEGGTEYLTPSLVFVGGTATGSIVENVNETSATDSHYLSLKTPENLFTDQITPEYEDDFTGYSGNLEDNGDWYNAQASGSPATCDGSVVNNGSSEDRYAVSGLTFQPRAIQLTANTSSASSVFQVLLRKDPSGNTHFVTGATSHGASVNLQLFQFTTSFQLRATTSGANIPTNTDNTFTVNDTGSAIHCSVNGSTVSYNSTANNDKVDCGFRTFNSSANVIQTDDFKTYKPDDYTFLGM